MKSAQPTKTQSPAKRCTSLLLVALSLVSACGLTACGGNSDAGFSAPQQGVAGNAVQTSGSGGSAFTAGASSTTRAGTGGDGTNAGGSSGSSGVPEGGSTSGGATSIAGSGGAAEAGTSGGVGACSSTDLCAACLCSKCPTQVKTCESTPGCQTIANCVATSRCDGAACYCGTSDTLTCAAGTANGPCRDVILNAPGGRKPTLANQSAGPAADAATAVGTCGAKNSACTASCQ